MMCRENLQCLSRQDGHETVAPARLVMGYQGKLKDIKARRYFEMLPEQYRARMRLDFAYHHRSNTQIWIVASEIKNGAKHMIHLDCGKIISDQLVDHASAQPSTHLIDTTTLGRVFQPRPQPDKTLAKDQLQALQAMIIAWGVPQFCAMMFWILTKTESEIEGIQNSRLIPFNFNRIQHDLFSKLAKNNRLLKARQAGFTTFFLNIRLLLPVISDEGIASLLISQNTEYAQKHFMIAQRSLRYIGAQDPRDDTKNDLNKSLKENLLHTKYSNRRELVFDVLDSQLMVFSAEVEESGQGVTIHHGVGSEVSRWPGNPEETVSNIKGSMVPGGTWDEECTANGFGGYFCEQCLRSMDDETKADARFHFYPWWWSDEYRLDIDYKAQKELLADLDADEKRLREKFHLDLKQIAWRRVTMIDQRGNFFEKYPEDPITAFLVTGKQYFDRDILIARKMELTNFKPYRTYDNGNARFFHPRIPGRRYLIGVDCATGREVSSEDTDYAAAVCIDLETGEEMAAYRAKVRPEDLAQDVADIGTYYNNAVVAVERTGDGGTCILALQGECKYGAIYKHKEWFKRQRQKVIELEGFPTTPKTRPVALNKLNAFIMDHPELIWDEKFIDEALVFVRDEKGKPQATQGAHDDRVSARWIAYYCRLVLLGYYDPLNAQSEKYTSADRLVVQST